MKSMWLLLVLGWRFAGLSAAQEPLPSSQGRVTSIPQGAAVSLKLPQRALLGDSLDGEFVITNSGNEPFTVETGGDYRGSTVHRRLKVVVTDPSGVVLPDLSKRGIGMGGFLGIDTLKPRESKAINCPLHGYAVFVEPGVYTITAQHDLGWRLPTNSPALVARATIELTVPTGKEALERVRKLTEETDQANSWHLQNLQHPIFTAPLRAEAKAGRVQACVGLANIPSKEANEALLELAQSESREMARAAALALTTRLPSLKDPSKTALAPFWDLKPRTHILEAWHEEFDKPLLAVAHKFLASVDPPATSSRSFSGSGSLRPQDIDMVSLGAQIIEARGGDGDVAALLAATQRVLDKWAEPRTGPGANTLDAPAPLQALIRAMDALRQRGWRASGSGRTAALLAYFRQLADPTIPRPDHDRWKRTLHAFIDANPPAFRENAIRAIPTPITDEWEKPLMIALEDRDWGVVRIACEVAGKSGRKSFIRPLAQVVEGIHESFVQGAAHDAAVKLGGGIELWEAWCEVIPDQERVSVALQRLFVGTIALPTSGVMSGTGNFSRDQRFRIRQTWREFLTKHRALLAGGGQVPESDPTVLPLIGAMDLGSGGFVVSLGLKDGTYWPRRK